MAESGQEQQQQHIKVMDLEHSSRSKSVLFVYSDFMYVPVTLGLPNSHLSPMKSGGHLHFGVSGESIFVKQVPLFLHQKD